MNNSRTIQFRHRLGIIIPTRNRLELLAKLLMSIEKQTVQPDQVLIVDGSDQPLEKELKTNTTVPITYVHVKQPSLTKQRNIGIQNLNDAVTLVCFLDDDIEFEPDTVEKLLTFWQTCPDTIGGTQFNIVNNPTRNLLVGLFTRIFCIDSKIPGKVLRSGFVSAEVPLTKNIKSEWLCGGATIWKREILANYRFDEWYAGWAYQEDVDFSYSVSKKYDLFFLYESKVWHNPPPYNKMKNAALGKMAVINRYHFVKKYPELSVFQFYWSTFGLIILNILKSVKERDFGGLREAKGTISGLCSILSGNLIQIDENFRK